MQSAKTTSQETTKLAGAWVGIIHTDEGAEFIRLSFAEQWCDLPQRKQLNLRVTVAETGNSFTVADALPFAIAGTDHTQGITGHLNGTSRFHLWPVTKSDTNFNRTIGGSYRLTNGRAIFVLAEAALHWPVWQLYYREGDSLVRLYPVGEERYWSEGCELFTFAGGALTVRTANGQQFMGSRVILYAEETLEVTLDAGYKLTGSLLTPPQLGPHPLVILVHGAGPGLRDDYRVVADLFARQGLAVFFYDKRGWGESTGEQLWSDIVKLADDAEAVIRQLRRHPQVDAKRVGVWGFSNGGWVAPLAASRFNDIAFVISFSGSGVSPARQEQYRRCWVAQETLGASPAQVALLWRFWEQVMHYLITGEWTAAVAQVIAEVENDAGLQALPKHEGYPDFLQPVPPVRTQAEWLALGGQGAEMGFDPVPIFQKLTAPILFVWGEQDSIMPVEASRIAIEAGLQDRNNYTILLAPNAGHLFLLDPSLICARPIGDEMQLLMRAPRAFAPGLWQKIMEWVQQNL